MCKLSFIHLVNENSSILSLLLLFSHIFSANCVCHLLARSIMCRFNKFTMREHELKYFHVINITSKCFHQFQRGRLLKDWVGFH
jgi:hypothetical protein